MAFRACWCGKQGKTSRPGRRGLRILDIRAIPPSLQCRFYQPVHLESYSLELSISNTQLAIRADGCGFHCIDDPAPRFGSR